ncbi:hypothetical protein LXA43DRAFT_1167925 [Ganoderma leucocontextum]|nr:hypothetical protein LXA43DRAFT_1167925 [Ganoderma leucocontextum]
MYPHPSPPSIPGLFQFPPPLESPLGPPHSQISPAPTRSSLTTSASAARHDHNLTFAAQISSYTFPHHGDHYSQQARTYSPPSLRLEPLPAHTESRRRLTSLTPPLTASASPANPQAPDSALSVRPSSFSPSPRVSEYVQPDRLMNSYQANQQHRQHPWSSAAQPPPHVSHAGDHAHAYTIHGSLDGDISVKFEESAEEQPAMWSHEPSQMAYTYDAQSYSYDAVDEDMHECKEEHADEGFDSSTYTVGYPQQMLSPSQNQPWNDEMYTSPPHTLYVAIPDYTISYDEGAYAESPIPAAPEMHTYPAASLHKILPTRTVATRSYTLEGAITPLSPKPVPIFAPHATTPASPSPPVPSKRKTQSPPPMDYLRPPPTPPASHPSSSSPASVASTSASGPVAQAPPHPHAHEASSSPPSDSQGPLIQKRPRGRPRKDKRAPSPPALLDHPFPHRLPPAAGAQQQQQQQADPPGQAMFKLNMGMGGGEGGEEGGGGGDGEGREPEKKKPIMACLFCRERKIACGPPAPGGPQRCNQCTRRGLVCEYPKESRRGQHKRGARAARVEALASAAASAGGAAAIKPKPRPKPKVDTANTAPALGGSGAGAGSDGGMQMQMQAQAPTSPLTPLPSPLPLPLPSPASGSGSGSPPASAKSAANSNSNSNSNSSAERKSRTEKDKGAQAGASAKGKERAQQKQRVRAVNASGSVGESVGRKGGGSKESTRGGGGGSGGVRYGFAPSELAMAGMGMGTGT